jgi:hypothetical protein
MGHFAKFIKIVRNTILGNCQYVNISGDHYIYAYKTDEVETAVRSFIEGLE